jgi:hypothetical protein
MSDTPLRDALDNIPKNELLIQGEVTKDTGAAASLTLEREKDGLSGGVVATISQKKGWGIGAFFKKVWR